MHGGRETETVAAVTVVVIGCARVVVGERGRAVDVFERARAVAGGWAVTAAPPNAIETTAALQRLGRRATRVHPIGRFLRYPLSTRSSSVRC